MNEIRCPNCKTAFKIDETGYADIQRQVRDSEFEKQLAERLELFEEKQKTELKLVQSQADSKYQKTAADKDSEIQSLKAKLDEIEIEKQLAVSKAVSMIEKEKDELLHKLEQMKHEAQSSSSMIKIEHSKELQKTTADKDSEIQSLKAKLEESEIAQKLAVTQAVNNVEKEKHELANRLEQIKREAEVALELANEKREREVQKTTADKDAQIQELKAKLETTQVEQKLETSKVLNALEKEKDELLSQIKHAQAEKELSEKAIIDKFNTQLKDRDDAIERLRDMKARLSTKMVGETLEQHCEVEFNRIRAMAFQRSYFEKDNDARSGSKGDYIFRDFDENNTETVSIMFEMKNECDTTATKKKNEDFLKELDKDRNEKGCEYAVLVSLLEPENELYNSGIVDMSYRFPKMYVIRPQFFIPIITLLRNASLKSLQYKNELAIIKEQNLDVTNFENNLNKFKEAFSRNYELASKQFEKAISEIDKSIDHLQKTKEALLKTDNQFRLANNKADDITIKKLTRNNPTMIAKFKEYAS